MYKINDIIVHRNGKERIRKIEDINETTGKYRFNHPFGDNNFVGFGDLKELVNYETVKDIPTIVNDTKKEDYEKIINQLIDKVNHLNKLILG